MQHGLVRFSQSNCVAATCFHELREVQVHTLKGDNGNANLRLGTNDFNVLPCSSGPEQAWFKMGADYFAYAHTK